MAKRTLVIDGADRGHFFLCVEGGTLSVGDSPGHADIVLRNLRVVGVRCEVEVEDELVVAGNPATLTSRRELRPGEDLRIGRSHLRFTGAAGGGPGPATAPADGPEAPAARTGTAPLLKRLLVIDGADRGRAFRLPESGSRIVGKSSSQADIRLNDLYVSRMHCAIKVRDDKVYVTHREGDGTLIDGKRITGEQELRPGEVLRVGNSSLRLETVLAEDGPPAHEDSEALEEDRTEHALAVAGDDTEEAPAGSRPPARGPARGAGGAGPRPLPRRAAAGPRPFWPGLQGHAPDEQPCRQSEGALPRLPGDGRRATAVRPGAEGRLPGPPRQPGHPQRRRPERGILLDRPGTR